MPKERDKTRLKRHENRSKLSYTLVRRSFPKSTCVLFFITQFLRLWLFFFFCLQCVCLSTHTRSLSSYLLGFFAREAVLPPKNMANPQKLSRAEEESFRVCVPNKKKKKEENITKTRSRQYNQLSLLFFFFFSCTLASFCVFYLSYFRQNYFFFFFISILYLYGYIYACQYVFFFFLRRCCEVIMKTKQINIHDSSGGLEEKKKEKEIRLRTPR